MLLKLYSKRKVDSGVAVYTRGSPQLYWYGFAFKCSRAAYTSSELFVCSQGIAPYVGLNFAIYETLKGEEDGTKAVIIGHLRC